MLVGKDGEDARVGVCLREGAGVRRRDGAWSLNPAPTLDVRAVRKQDN